MAIFPSLELEQKLQVDDKTRLDARKSFISTGEAAITLVEIQPEASESFIDVTSNKYLDWQYATNGTKSVIVRITTDGAPVTFSKDIEVLSIADDKLFSGDAELVPHEPDVLQYTREGRNSFLDVHRTAQDRILTWLDEHRIWDDNGDRLTKAAIIDLEEVNDWSKFLTLKMIFEGLSNAIDDIFHEKAMRYESMMVSARNRASLRLDRDGDGEEDLPRQDMRSLRMHRG
jgi:hypothetical protein